MSSNYINAVPDASCFKVDQQYGGSFKLNNDNVHYLSIDKTVFNNIKNDYTIELWFKLIYFPIVVKNNGDEYIVQPILFSMSNCNLQCGPIFITLNNKDITKYVKGQWHQLCFTYGEHGTINSTISKIYLNGQLITKEANLFNNFTFDNILIGKGIQPFQQYAINNANDNQQLEWAIFKLYNRSLQKPEIYRNFLAHSHRFGLNSAGQYPIIKDGLLAYFDAGQLNSYKYPSLTLKSIGLPVKNINKKKSVNYIYNLSTYPSSIMNQEPDAQVLSKLIGQLLSRRQPSKNTHNVDISELIIAKPLPSNYDEQAQTIDIQKILSQFKNANTKTQIQKINMNEIRANPVKLDILRQFFINNPQALMEILSNSRLSPSELNELYNLVSGPNSKSGDKIIIDTFASNTKPQRNTKQILFDDGEQNMSSLNQPNQTELLRELKMLREELKRKQTIIADDSIVESQSSKQKREQKIKEVMQLNTLESELQKLVQSDIVTDKTNQIQLFQLIQNFQKIKNNLLMQANQSPVFKMEARIKNQIDLLESQLKNLAKVCLHAPNILGYVSDGNSQVGLIDKNGQIDYIKQNQNHPGKPMYITLRNSPICRRPPTLPTVVDYLNQPPQKNHQLVGQVVDSSEQLSLGLIMKNQDKHYLVLISPVPKLSDIPILAIKKGSKNDTQTHKNTSTDKKQSCKEGQKCLPGLQPEIYEAGSDWMKKPSNENTSQKKHQMKKPCKKKHQLKQLNR